MIDQNGQNSHEQRRQAGHSKPQFCSLYAYNLLDW